VILHVLILDRTGFAELSTLVSRKQHAHFSPARLRHLECTNLNRQHLNFRQLNSSIPPQGAALGQPSYVTEIIEFQNATPFA